MIKFMCNGIMHYPLSLWVWILNKPLQRINCTRLARDDDDDDDDDDDRDDGDDDENDDDDLMLQQ